MTILPANSLRPTIIVDNCEKAPLQFTRLAARPAPLPCGSYSFAGGEDIFAIECKTLEELVLCCMGASRVQFASELLRLRGYRFKRLVIQGTPLQIETGAYPSNIKPRSVLATLAAIEARFDMPVVFCETPAQAALQIESWACWQARELINTAKELETCEQGGAVERTPLASS